MQQQGEAYALADSMVAQWDAAFSASVDSNAAPLVVVAQQPEGDDTAPMLSDDALDVINSARARGTAAARVNVAPAIAATALAMTYECVAASSAATGGIVPSKILAAAASVSARINQLEALLADALARAAAADASAVDSEAAHAAALLVLTDTERELHTIRVTAGLGNSAVHKNDAAEETVAPQPAVPETAVTSDGNAVAVAVVASVPRIVQPTAAAGSATASSLRRSSIAPASGTLLGAGPAKPVLKHSGGAIAANAAGGSTLMKPTQSSLAQRRSSIAAGSSAAAAAAVATAAAQPQTQRRGSVIAVPGSSIPTLSRRASVVSAPSAAVLTSLQFVNEA